MLHESTCCASLRMSFSRGSCRSTVSIDGPRPAFALLFFFSGGSARSTSRVAGGMHATSLVCAVMRCGCLTINTWPVVAPLRTTRSPLTYGTRRGVIKKLEDRPDSVYFRAPVKRKIYPNYYTKIKKPMDLRTIQDKINSFE